MFCECLTHFITGREKDKERGRGRRERAVRRTKVCEIVAPLGNIKLSALCKENVTTVQMPPFSHRSGLITDDAIRRRWSAARWSIISCRIAKCVSSFLYLSHHKLSQANDTCAQCIQSLGQCKETKHSSKMSVRSCVCFFVCVSR